MRIELLNLAPAVDGRPLGTLRTPWGTAELRWCGEPDAAPGEYDIEYTVDEEFAWGRNARTAREPTPAVRSDGGLLLLRGVFSLTVDGAGLLTVGGDVLLLDIAGAVPEPVAAGAWVELTVAAGEVTVWPYDL